jgi:hypothetical protein
MRDPRPLPLIRFASMSRSRIWMPVSWVKSPSLAPSLYVRLSVGGAVLVTGQGPPSARDDRRFDPEGPQRPAHEPPCTWQFLQAWAAA